MILFFRCYCRGHLRLPRWQECDLVNTCQHSIAFSCCFEILLNSDWCSVRYLHTTTVVAIKIWTLPKFLISLSLNLMNLAIKCYIVLFLTAWSSKSLSVISRGLPRKYHRSQICKYCQLENRATISPLIFFHCWFCFIEFQTEKGLCFVWIWVLQGSRKHHFYQNTLAKFPKWSFHLYTSTSVPWWLLY